MTENVLWKRGVKVGKVSDSGRHLQFVGNLLSLIDDTSFDLDRVCYLWHKLVEKIYCPVKHVSLCDQKTDF